MELLKDKNGKISSKRIMGILCIVFSSILAWIGRDVSVIGIFSGIGLTLLGLGVAEK